MPSSSEKDLQRIAYHEAGHAVATFALGRQFVGVSIVPDSQTDSLGRVQVRRSRLERQLDRETPRTPAQRKQLEDRIVTIFAGAEAESRFRDCGVRTVMEEGGADSDLQMVEYLGEALESPEVVPALLAYLQARAADLVRVHWFLVEPLAEELVVRSEVSAHGVRGLIRKTVFTQNEAEDFAVSGNETAAGLRHVADLIGRSKPHEPGAGG